MNGDNKDTEPKIDAKRRRFLLTIALVGFVVWMGFMLRECAAPPPIPRGGREMRELAAKHVSFENHNPLAQTEPVRHRGKR